MRARRIFLVLTAASTIAACSDPVGSDGGEPPPPPESIALEAVAGGLENPVHLTAPPGDPRLFVVEQPGTIRIVEGGEVLSTPFLDLSEGVASGGERGLLSMAFHPEYGSNGLFYVDYTDTGGDTRIERYRVSNDPDVADPASATLILSIEQPFANHNGGLVAFGPDGWLYIGMGDGGSGGDPRGHGQDPGTLLGALLRIDVDAGNPFAIPPDNPFVGDPDGRDEVWAYGLRNPWRFAFDPAEGTLYVADVGQNDWEEVSVVDDAAVAPNFGWNVMEGAHCFGQTECDMDGLVLPVLEYPNGEGCSIIGGHVYRGDALPGLRGHYFYSDLCAGFLRTFRLEDGEAVERREWEVENRAPVLSFGVDGAGELHLLSGDGTVYRIVEP